jgi:hypothetical protein
VSEKGFFARTNFQSDAAQYCTKWGLADELTMSQAKDGAEGRSWWKILFLAKSKVGYYYARALEYIEATKRQRHIVYSNGLRGLIEQYRVEQALQELQQEPGKVVMIISPRTWVGVLRMNERGNLLAAFDAGDRNAAEDILDMCLIATYGECDRE